MNLKLPGMLGTLAACSLAACSDDASRTVDGAGGAPEAAPEWPPTDAQTRAGIEAAFQSLSDGRITEHVEQNFAPDATLVIHGPQEFGAGTFTGRADIIRNFEHVYEVVPTHAFVLHEIWVTTTPDEVTAAVVWSDAAQLPDGTPLPTEGMNRIRNGPQGVIEEHIFLTPEP